MPRKEASPPPNTYRAHRERQRRRILDAASTLFDERGIDRVTMAEITSASGVQPSTMYQYFSGKDDIVWAILGELMQESSGQASRRIDGASNAFARLTALLDFMADELAHNQVKVRFMAQFDAMYARDWPAQRLLTLESQINPQGFQFFTKLIREGIADGSLRSDLDPELTMHAVINAVIGAQRRLASLGNKVELEYGQPIDRLFRETIRILLLGLRAPETPAVRRPAKPSKAARSTTRKRSR
jgi:AcrR family transcriptional regulator